MRASMYVRHVGCDAGTIIPVPGLIGMYVYLRLQLCQCLCLLLRLEIMFNVRKEED